MHLQQIEYHWDKADVQYKKLRTTCFRDNVENNKKFHEGKRGHVITSLTEGLQG